MTLPRRMLTAFGLVLGLVTVLTLTPAGAGECEGCDHETALLGLDPVLLVEGKRVPGSPDRIAEHKSFTYRFSSDRTRKTFLKDPDEYSIQGDGTCIMAPGTPVNADIFTVHQRKIYAFAGSQCLADFEANPAAVIAAATGSKRSSDYNVAIFVHEGVEILDFGGPGEVFAATSGFNVYTVAASTEPIVSQGFVKVIPEYTLANAPRPDIVVLPGGATGIPMKDPAVIAWIEKTAKDAEVMLSVCSGAFLLAKAGLLDGLQATTWHGSIASLRESAPKTRVLENTRFVDNGQVVTTAGVSAGIDGALHVVSRLMGEATAAKTAHYMEYDRWEPNRGTVVRASDGMK